MSGQTIFAGIGVLLIALGLPLAQRRVRPDAWYGLRIPATFADAQVWYEANAASGRDLLALGVVLIVVALGLPHIVPLSPKAYVYACSALLLVGTLGSAFRGWRLGNRIDRTLGLAIGVPVVALGITYLVVCGSNDCNPGY